MRTRDLHELPKVRDGWSYLYAEHCKIDREDKAIAIHDKLGLTPVPCAALSLLMLGPGTRITHAAILTLADSGCLVAWVGENSVRYYASGMGETRQSLRLMKQAALASHGPSRLRVVRRLYEMRFPVKLDPELTLQQIRGKEGVRVRDSYGEASRRTGVAWTGRTYNRQNWGASDPINRALSSANACLYGVAHSAIVAAGYSPGLGFIHVGKMLSFVYDIADLYKAETTIPAAFECVAQGDQDLERRVRLRLRDSFREANLLGRIVDDIAEALDVPNPEGSDAEGWDLDPALPAGLWDDEKGAVAGGVDYSGEPGTEPE
ncbi:type I-E CRISPR-associated endonuclease Cas1 [Candidatus Sumerlaeota bacterium]|nr:type I-E CRISPR-associated endonuclease Cas1 [Candidatus Sumerlaeota bacterium]